MTTATVHRGNRIDQSSGERVTDADSGPARPPYVHQMMIQIRYT
jgi:hypothetical protein